MKPELKYIIPYLEHEVKIIIPHTAMICTVSGVSVTDGTLEIDYPRKKRHCSGEILSFKDNQERGHSSYIENCKMILRPLSDLTKEIEIDGEKFVPIEVLLDKRHGVDRSEREYRDIVIEVDNPSQLRACYKLMASKDISIYKSCMDNMDYWIIQRLFEWHFDVFGLIEQGLAIDTNKQLCK